MLLPYFSTNQSSVGQFLVGISSFQELPTCFECTPEAASCSPLLSLLQPENFNVFLTKERSGLQNVALASLLALPPLCPPSPQLPAEFEHLRLWPYSYLIHLFAGFPIAQTGLTPTVQLKVTLNTWSPTLYFLNVGITDTRYHAGSHHTPF